MLRSRVLLARAMRAGRAIRGPVRRLWPSIALGEAPIRLSQRRASLRARRRAAYRSMFSTQHIEEPRGLLDCLRNGFRLKQHIRGYHLLGLGKRPINHGDLSGRESNTRSLRAGLEPSRVELSMESSELPGVYEIELPEGQPPPAPLPAYGPTKSGRKNVKLVQLGLSVRQSASDVLTPPRMLRLDKGVRWISNCDLDLAGGVTEPVARPPLGRHPLHARILGCSKISFGCGLPHS
jgi:hypothetical protein